MSKTAFSFQKKINPLLFFLHFDVFLKPLYTFVSLWVLFKHFPFSWGNYTFAVLANTKHGTSQSLHVFVCSVLCVV